MISLVLGERNSKKMGCGHFASKIEDGRVRDGDHDPSSNGSVYGTFDNFVK